MDNFLLIAFDLDDTLYPEVDFVKSGFAAVAQYLNDLDLIKANSFLEAALSLFSKGIRGKIFDFTLEQLEVDYSEDLISDLLQIYREHHPQIQPFTEAVKILQKLREQGRTIALISDGSLTMQTNKLKALGLENYFHHLILTGAYGPAWSKPHDKAFVEVMSRSKVEARDCIYIADNPKKDFLAPNRLGWHTIRIKEEIGIYYHEIPPVGGEPRETLESLKALWERLTPQT